MSDIEIGFAHRDLPYSATFMPGLMDRIRQFCNEIETDANADELVDWIWRLYATRDPRWGLWFLYKPGDGVVGHLFAHVDPFDAKAPKTVLIRQAKADPRFDTRAANEKVMEEVDAWALKLGIKTQTIVTHRNETAMLRRWGFEPYKHIMRKHL